MSALVPALVPPRTRRPRADVPGVAVGRTLPLPNLQPFAARTTVYAMAGVDSRGRVGDRSVLAALGWPAGTRVSLQVTNGMIVGAAVADGPFAVTSQGHLRLPAGLRRGCGVRAGDRVLLAADPVAGRLAVYPPVALDALLTVSAGAA